MTEQDLVMLHDRLNRPHIVARWGGDRPALDEVLAQYRPAARSRHRVTPYIGLPDGRPFTFAQSCVALGAGDGSWPDETDPGVRGIDQSIAEPELLGRGLGTRRVRALVSPLFADPDVTRVPTNLGAIRCCDKAGFRQVGTITRPDGPAVQMLHDRPSSWPSSAPD